MADESIYGYDLGKTILPGFLVKGIKIRDSWVNRCKRYLGAGEPDLNRLVKFIKRGLYDSSAEGFNERALDNRLTVAQQWLLLYLVLKDGVPEWVRDPENDEDAPELIVEEPAPATTVSKAVGAAGAVAGVAVKPVTSLKQMITGVSEEPEATEATEEPEATEATEEPEGE
jgi:hypothetical protein